MFAILPNTLRAILASFIWTKLIPQSAPPTLQFHLRHTHGIATNDTGSRVIFADIPAHLVEQDTELYTLNTKDVITHQPPSIQALSSARLRSMRDMQSEDLRWRANKIMAPDVRRRETLLTLAKMTYNSYYESGHKDWHDLGPEWNTSYSYGWEPDQDGFRGHIFVSSDESIVVISIKGTSAPWIAGGEGPTKKKDKLNDNLLFSCCCAKVGPTWSTVCDCHKGGWKCDLGCVEKSLEEESLFYSVGLNLYNNVTYMYPKANIWLVGHSLGGSLAALVGATFGNPVVAFEAPAERMAAKRLHLPSPPSMDHITHVFHNADPIPMGQCTGVTSFCANGGYALESQCHQGKIIKYDTVGKKHWSSSVTTHPIKYVIESLLNEDWEPGDEEKGIQPVEVPDAVDEEADCQDCYKWDISDQGAGA